MHCAKKAHGRRAIAPVVLPAAATLLAGGQGCLLARRTDDVRLCAPAGTGALESVKVIRDKATRCGPGFALPLALAAHVLFACVVSGACSLFSKWCVAAESRHWCSWRGSASAGYGFITFSSHTVAESVLGAYNGVPIPNTDLVFRLNWAAFGVGKITSEGALRHAWSKAPATGAIVVLFLLRVWQSIFYFRALTCQLPFELSYSAVTLRAALHQPTCALRQPTCVFVARL